MPFLVLKCSTSHSDSFGAYLVKICCIVFVLHKLHIIPVWHTFIAIPLIIYFCIHSQCEYTIVEKRSLHAVLFPVSFCGSEKDADNGFGNDQQYNNGLGRQFLLFCPETAPKTILEGLKPENFLGEHAPRPP